LNESTPNEKRHNVINGGGDAFYYKEKIQLCSDSQLDSDDTAASHENVFENGVDDVGVCASDESTESEPDCDVNISGPSNLIKLSENDENVRTLLIHCSAES
jgi:hypothetical protein